MRLRNPLLRLNIAALTLGWPVLAALALVCLSFAGALCVTLSSNEKLSAERDAVISLKQQVAQANRRRVNMPPTNANGSSFYEILSNPGQIEPQLASLFAKGSDNGIAVKKASYDRQWVKDGNYGQYMITCPVTGTYLSIHRFVRQALTDVPNLSLDDIEFKRGNVSSNSVEAKLHFTLFVNDKPADRVITSVAVDNGSASLAAAAFSTDLPPLPDSLR